MQVSGAGNQMSVASQRQSAAENISKGSAAPFADVLAATSSGNEAEANVRSSKVMDTNQGKVAVDLETYLSPQRPTGPVNLMDVPLLLPTAHNVDTLSRYSEEKFKALLDEHNIAPPPAMIEFDAEGKLVLPRDYPHASELRQALEAEPETENALRTTAALASHYAGIMESAAFGDEMATAQNQLDQDRIVEKYSYLFDDNRPANQIVLSFLEDGSMLVGEKYA